MERKTGSSNCAQILTLALVIIMGLTAVSQAALVMYIDTATKQLSIIGTDSGANVDAGGPVLLFRGEVAEGTLGTSEILDLNPTVNVSGASEDPKLNFYEFTTPDVIQFSFFSTSEGAVSLEGTGVITSYAGLEAANIAGLESLVGSSFNLFVGSGFSPIQVQSIPEPSTSTFSMLALSLLALRRRR